MKQTAERAKRRGIDELGSGREFNFMRCKEFEVSPSANEPTTTTINYLGERSIAEMWRPLTRFAHCRGNATSSNSKIASAYITVFANSSTKAPAGISPWQWNRPGIPLPKPIPAASAGSLRRSSAGSHRLHLEASRNSVECLVLHLPE